MAAGIEAFAGLLGDRALHESLILSLTEEDVPLTRLVRARNFIDYFSV